MCQEIAPKVFNMEAGFVQPKRMRSDLVVAQLPETPELAPDLLHEEIGSRLGEKIRSVLGRSLAIREVDAGSCNGCEVEVSALNNPIYDVERFGVHFVASPRHADVLLVTGVASRNMELALKRTYDATPDPKIVVAIGACACSGGLFGDTYASSGGITKVVPVDVFVPGCPPRPEAILCGLLLAVDRVGKVAAAPDEGRSSERR
jgi:Ni,Fe-hydrogenase III small subunit